MQSVESRPDEQVQQQQRGKLIKIANEVFRRPPP
jgi:hypothetical protein